MLWRLIVAMLASVLVAGCAVVPHAPGSADLGVPAAIGNWTVRDDTPDPKTDAGQMWADFAWDFIEAAGGTTATGAWATFTVRDADGVVTHVDGYRVIGARPDAMWGGADGVGIAGISTVAITPGGWDLRHWGDNGAWIAVRDDRAFTFPGGQLAPTRDQVQTFLDALN
jgi:hypothetical protein